MHSISYYLSWQVGTLTKTNIWPALLWLDAATATALRRHCNMPSHPVSLHAGFPAAAPQVSSLQCCAKGFKL